MMMMMVMKMMIMLYIAQYLLGDWIIQERLQNDDWLNALLPSNAPLSTMRVITTSTWSMESTATIVTTTSTTTPPASDLTTSGGEVKEKGTVADSSNSSSSSNIINGNGGNGNEGNHGDDSNAQSNIGSNLMSPNSLITSSDYNQSGRYDGDDNDKDDNCVEFNNDDSFNIGSDVVTIDNADNDDDDDDDNHHNSGMLGVNPIATTTTTRTTPAATETISGFSMKIENIYQPVHDDENSFYYKKSPSTKMITNGGRYVKYIKAESGVLRLGSTCVTV
jgi:hypothetical protein